MQFNRMIYGQNDCEQKVTKGTKGGEKGSQCNNFDRMIYGQNDYFEQKVTRGTKGFCYGG